MDVDTDTVRAVSGRLEMLALDWFATPTLHDPVPDAATAFGSTPLGVELSLGMVAFTRRSQECVTELVTRLHWASEALLTCAVQFEHAEATLAMDQA